MLTIGFGCGCSAGGWALYSKMGWLHLKLALVALLVVYHVWCYRYLRAFRELKHAHAPVVPLVQRGTGHRADRGRAARA